MTGQSRLSTDLRPQTIMSMPVIDRRKLLAAGAVMTAGAAAPGTGDADAQTSAAPAGRAFTPRPMPLPFDPRTFTGLFDRLAPITTRFAGLDVAGAPGFMINAWRRRRTFEEGACLICGGEEFCEPYFGRGKHGR